MSRQRPVPTLSQQRRLLLWLAIALVLGLVTHACLSPAAPRQLDEAVEQLDSTAAVVRRLSQDLPIAQIGRARQRIEKAIAAVSNARAQVQTTDGQTEAERRRPVERLSAAADALEKIGRDPMADPRASVLATQSTLDRAYTALLEQRRTLADQRAERRSFWGRLQRDVLGLAAWLGPSGTLLSIAVAIVLFMTPPGHLLRPLSGVSWRLRGLNVAGFRVDFDAEAIRSDKTEIEYALNVIATQYRTHYHAAARKHQVQHAVGLVARHFVHEIEREQVDETGEFNRDRVEQAKFRATVHVPFYIDRHEVIQLAEYVDATGNLIDSVSRVGRVFSQRFGIIGRACRESPTSLPGMPRYDPYVPDPRALEREYGMTKGEANAKEAGGQRVTFFATPIRDQAGDILGIFYVDMKQDYGLGWVKRPNDHETAENSLEPTSIDHGANIHYAKRLTDALIGVQSYRNLAVKLEQVRDDVGWDENQVIRPAS